MKAQEREANKKVWEQRIAEFEASGKMQEEWCEERGITLSALRYWRRKFRKQKEENEAPGWLKVEAKDDQLTIPEASAGTHDSISIRYADISIHLPLSAKKETIREVVEALMRI